MIQDYLHLFPNYIAKTVPTVGLSEQFLNRYPRVPAEYLDFLESFSLLSNKSDTTWFNSIEDFNEEGKGAFRWDEFERQSMEAVEGDDYLQQQVRYFWDSHVPFILSVEDGYSHFSIGVSEKNWGKIYFGEEPEYEEVEWVADSFLMFMQALAGGGLAEKYRRLFV
ncbi:hypothetical protein [Sphingobacterium tabacisoli]|uniref:SMI1/KNR4 family protein n=1 Tax=Sphingobacterium tabacisoli TaxID=2044855 RepID=A0ABW5L5W9_9SPHI|nr:hypothetical protein [Sphingobacterium tabacisoli]